MDSFLPEEEALFLRKEGVLGGEASFPTLPEG